MSSTINSYEYVFPLVGGESLTPQNPFEIRQICGTAFHLKGGNYITAGHAVKNALQHDQMGLAHLDGAGKWRIQKVTKYEVVDDYDIGFVKVEASDTKAMQWDFGQLPLLSEVCTFGYAYALDVSNRSIGARAFQGYIVASPILDRLHARPRCYELSFQCPRGLSGAPVYTNDFDRKGAGVVSRVKGIIVGNQSMEMLVFSEKEILREGKEVVVERYEAMQTGIAIQTEALKGVKSTILGGELVDYLRSVALDV